MDDIQMSRIVIFSLLVLIVHGLQLRLELIEESYIIILNLVLLLVQRIERLRVQVVCK